MTAASDSGRSIWSSRPWIVRRRRCSASVIEPVATAADEEAMAVSFVHRHLEEAA